MNMKINGLGFEVVVRESKTPTSPIKMLRFMNTGMDFEAVCLEDEIDKEIYDPEGNMPEPAPLSTGWMMPEMVLYSPHYRAMFGLENVEGFEYVEGYWNTIKGEIDDIKS
jgi:hypothetical protein